MISIPQPLQGKLIGYPETTPGAHVVNLKLSNGLYLLGITVVNATVALIDPDLQVASNDIVEVQF